MVCFDLASSHEREREREGDLPLNKCLELFKILTISPGACNPPNYLIHKSSDYNKEFLKDSSKMLVRSFKPKTLLNFLGQ